MLGRIQKLCGIGLMVLSLCSLVSAQGDNPCKSIPGRCAGIVTVTWLPGLPMIVGLACIQNCPTVQCSYLQDNSGKSYCACPTDPDANQDGFIDTVLCNVGWTLEPGVGVITSCVVSVGCAASEQCTLDVAGPVPFLGGVQTSIRCCCK